MSIRHVVNRRCWRLIEGFVGCRAHRRALAVLEDATPLPVAFAHPSRARIIMFAALASAAARPQALPSSRPVPARRSAPSPCAAA